jgi:hypothetical protein
LHESQSIVPRYTLQTQTGRTIEALTVLQMEQTKVITPQKLKPNPIGAFVSAVRRFMRLE